MKVKVYIKKDGPFVLEKISEHEVESVEQLKRLKELLRRVRLE